MHWGYSAVLEEPPHPLELALTQTPHDAPPDARLEVIWQWYEDLRTEQLDRPPTKSQRVAVAEQLRSEQVSSLYLRQAQLAIRASRTVAEKAASLIQAPCASCEVVLDADGNTALSLLTAVDVEPWSAQSNPAANKIIKATVTQKLQEDGVFEPSSDPICISVVSFVPRQSAWSKKKDADNLVKGLLDSLIGVLYDDDRQIQCLTSRRVGYAGTEGYYLVSARAVHRWDADVVVDDGQPMKRLGRVGRIEPPLG